MSRSSNLDFFRQAVEKDPENVFARYSLGMELRKAGDQAAALEAFEALIDTDPAYIAAYLMAGQVAVELDDEDRAAAILRSGIERARENGNDHAASEMSDLLDEIA